MTLTIPRSRAVRRVAVPPPLPASPNGDEEAYRRADGRPSRVGSFAKGLEHDDHGSVVPEAYGSLRRALASGRSDHFAAIRLGGGGRGLAAPWATSAVEGGGPAARDLVVPTPPRLDSAEEAADMVELLWMALLRDVPFRSLASEPLAAAALLDLGRLTARERLGRPSGPRAESLFRGLATGDLRGPFMSQLLLHTALPGQPVGPARRRTAAPGRDHGTDWGAFLALQNGGGARGAMPFDPTRRLPRTPRDLAVLVRDDVPPQTAFLHAALVLLTLRVELADGGAVDTAPAGSGWAGFGGARLLDLIGEAAGRALRAAWWQKWYVHRRARPEAVGGLLHRSLTGDQVGPDLELPLHADLLDAAVADEVHARHGTYLLPLAWPEGGPLHPSYTSAHAAVAGACATVLKAWFREEAPWPGPVEPTADGLAVTPFDGPPLRVGGEIDKLASNVAIGRAMAGVSRRSDVHAGLRLGEQVAMAVLAGRAAGGPGVPAFTFTRLDGTRATVERAQGREPRT